MLNDGIRAWRLMAVVAAWLQRYVHRGARAVDSVLVGMAEGLTLCVQVSVAGVVSLCYNLIVPYYQCSYQRIGINHSLSLLCQHHCLF